MNNNYLFSVYKQINIDFEYGKGSSLYDKKSNKYIDFTSGIGVNSLGHAHPKVIKTINKQANKLIHLSNIYSIKVQKECAKKIVKLSTYEKMKCFFCNSGAEANEAAIKFIRKYAYLNEIKNHKIITINNSFHGRTLTTLKATAQEDKQKGFGPFTDEFIYAKDIEDIKNKIDENTVAVMLELVQGEGGINAFDKKQIQTLTKELKNKKILLAIDEVQTGVYRTGEFLASNYYEIKPDIITLAKGLAGGLPIGVMMSDIEDVFTLGNHGSTFGGNPLCTRVALEVLTILEKRYKTKKLQKTVEIFQKELDNFYLKNKEYFVCKTGIGLMLGLKLKDENNLSKVFEEALKHKLLVLKSGKDIIRFLPSLLITEKEIKEGFRKLQKSIVKLNNKDKK
ncbi:acetylornithine/succinylornithine family transaminase [Halarcobacter bivalviorum]|uniref:acetylornithine/succinylornithine family transaminase n=1 Tax=Halarcobacter bivalviorum TaxID=663364 RepID=UPI00100B20D0|nr:acetylornithine/succinylornithine family transaminase [Halarcobacter bivalviorum]RXK06043.1 aspartate aminotransferase family protein [Halarcobacter bivalviorum]